MELNYNNYHATFKNNILNIYNNSNKLLTSKEYSGIVYSDNIEQEFKSSVDKINKSNNLTL